MSGLNCPKCGVGEDHPHDGDKPRFERRIAIRGHKVFSRGAWQSQCLVCSGFYDEKLGETPHNHDPAKGWFAS